jgi:hypothetical protein
MHFDEDNNKYVGEWQDDMRHGYGVECNLDGEIVFEGEWIEDKKKQ